MWRDRAEQVMGTANAFPDDRLAQAVALIYETDKRFREGYKDDRIIMEGWVMALTKWAGRFSGFHRQPDEMFPAYLCARLGRLSAPPLEEHDACRNGYVQRRDCAGHRNPDEHI